MYIQQLLVPGHRNLSHSDCVKASGLGDLKASCIALIQRPLSRSNREDFHVSPNMKDLCSRALDPQSDVSLFLSRKIKQQASYHAREWSHYLEEKLIENISPEFEKRFPHNRLGSAVVKKVWDKIAHLSGLFEKQKCALSSDGKLNLHFLIRENLKTIVHQKQSGLLHPYLLAQQLALKIGESLASYEGRRPHLSHLTQLISTALLHLLPAEKQTTLKKPSASDRLVIKWVVDILREEPQTPYAELSEQLEKLLKRFKTIKNLENEIYTLSVQWAQKLLPSTRLLQQGKVDDPRSWLKGLLNKDITHIKTEALAKFPHVQLADLEILYWSLHKPLDQTPLFLHELMRETQLHLIRHPLEHWRTAIEHAAHFLQSASVITRLGSTTDWKERIELWASQGELIFRFLELPPTPLIHLATEMHGVCEIKQSSFVSKLREQYLSRYSSPLIEPSLVHQMAGDCRKYVWYQLGGPTLQRWIDLQKPEAYQTRALMQFPLLPLIHSSHACA